MERNVVLRDGADGTESETSNHAVGVLDGFVAFISLSESGSCPKDR